MYNNNFNQQNQQNNSMYRIPNRIFVGGIPQTASQDELRDYFRHFGHVKDARIITDTRGNSKGFGFVTYDNENDASKVLSLKEEDLIFKENKLNIGHAFRKKNNFDQNQGGPQYQQGMRGQNGMGGQGQHHMMGGNMGGLGLGGQGSMGLHQGNMGSSGLGNMGGLGGLGGGGHPGGNNYLDSQMNGQASGMHPMNNMSGFGNNSQGMNPQGMNYGMNGHMGLGNMGALNGINGMNMN